MPLLLLIVMAPALAGAQVRPQESPFALRYRALVDAYRTGETATSVEGLLALDRDAVLGLVNRYVKLGQRGFPGDPVLDERFFRAASMLHADAAFLSWERWRYDGGAFHIELARRLVDVSEPAGAGVGSFRRRWYAATALILTGHLGEGEAIDYFDHAAKQLPDDVPLLTAAGWFSERLSNYPARTGTNLKNAHAIRRRHQERAMRFFRAALDIDPRAAEPALRLARVEVAIGNVGHARERLTALLAREKLPPLLGYVGRLLLGEVHEREGNRREAERLYREMMTLDPFAQSARVALARLLYASGDSAGAAEVIEPAVKRRSEGDRNDPWSDYQLAYPSIGRLLLDGLRREAQR